MGHVLLDLIHNLHRLHFVSSLEIVPFLLVGLVAAKDDDPEALGMSPAHLGSHDIIETDRSSLPRVLKNPLARVGRHDMEIIVVDHQNALVRSRKGHGLFPEDIITTVIAADQVLLLRKRVKHLMPLLAFLRGRIVGVVNQKRRVGRRAAGRPGQ